jgi:hypothetical protein
VTDERTARYLYAVCRGLDPLALDGVTGLGDRQLELVHHEQLAAVVSDVPLAEFDEDGLRRNLEDLAWLEPTVRVHDQVIHAAAVAAPTAPLRLATICYDDDAVRARLREWYVALMHALDRVEGCAEWSVKVLTSPRAAEPVSAGAAPLSGAEYLRRKKVAASERTSRDDAALDVAARLHEELHDLATASRQLAPQDPRLSGHQGTMVLNAAYLVPVADADRFAARVDELAAEHPEVVVDRRGPWPPYSFAMLEQR